ncbi:MAG TPA: hypothetical protein VIW25_05695 [Nitrososphaeraceae archaeon]|jgi:hypothetical protein
MASSNSGSRKGPTISWIMLKGKKVKSNDGKDVRDIEVARTLYGWKKEL